MPDTVVSRFAPSPTGQLHIGGARTALFAWLWARSAQSRGGSGRFLLRIEDTDAKRTGDRHRQSIMRSLDWLGLEWDNEQLIRQSERTDLYRQAAQQLLAQGQAYWCDCPAERLEQLRQRSRQQGSGRVYDGHCRSRGLAEGPGCALRIRAPDEARQTVWRDQVLGRQKTQLDFDHLDDFVLKRSVADGGAAGFTYHLCCVVDDAAMGVNTVVRGGDHLASVPRQLLLYQYLQLPPPAWAHLPLVLGSDGSRLSKRKGNQPMDQLRQEGHPPEAVVNFLARLGWSCGDRELFFSLSELTEAFAEGKIGRAPATCDLRRLAHLSGEHLRRTEPPELLSGLNKWITEAEPPPELLSRLPEWNADSEPPQALLELCRSRARTLAELAVSLSQLMTAPDRYRTQQGELNAQAAFDDEQRRILQRIRGDLSAVADSSWNAAAIAAGLRRLAEELGGGFRRIGAPMRLALAGSVQGPDVAELAFALGRDETLARLNAAIGQGQAAR